MNSKTPAPSVSPAQISGLTARKIALRLLELVIQKHQTLEAALESVPLAVLTPRDRGFARALAATVLRWHDTLDHLIRACLNEPNKRLQGGLWAVLRLAAAQSVFLKTPDHAVVSTSLALLETPELVGSKGFANAVIRRICREGAELLPAQDPSLNAPVWLRQILMQDYGLARTKEIIAACLTEAALDITVKNPAETGLWADRLAAALLPTGALRLENAGQVPELAGFVEGAWWVQDAASSLPVRILNPQPGQKILDICAAPGGKTAQLIAAGAEVTALDQSPKRLKRLESNLKRLAMHAEIIMADGTRYQNQTPADAILLDVPCSATGTLRRHPDALHLKNAEDLLTLLPLQAELLDNAVTLLKSGGMMVYCTCSLFKDEGERQITAFLERHPNMRLHPILQTEIPGLSDAITPEGMLRILPDMWPEHGGIDGFFIARMRKA